MKIAFLSHLDLNLYRFRLPVMRALREQGHEVWAVCPPGEYTSRFETEGIRVATYAMDRGSLNPLGELRVLWRLRRLLRDLDPQIVHAFTHKPNLYGTLCAPPGRVIRTVTGLGSFFIDDGLGSRVIRGVIEALYRTTDGRSARTLFQNRDDLQLFVERGLCSSRKAELVRGSGVDIERFRPTAPDPELRRELGLRPALPVVLMVARVIADKGVREYAQAAKRLGDRAEFLYVGGADAGNRSALIPDWGPVHYLGFREDVERWIALSDLVVLPSYREGVPRTLLEAAAMGKALVATDVPGCREVVRPGVNGLLVPPGDASALTEAIAGLIEDGPLREEYGKQSRRVAQEEFAVERVVERYLQIYAEVLQ